MYEVTVNLDRLPKGADVEVDGLGMFKNGETKTVSAEEADAFRSRNQTVTSKYDKKGGLVTDIQPGPTVLEALKGVDGFEVKTVKEEKK